MLKLHFLVVSMFTSFIHLRNEVDRKELINFLLFAFYILHFPRVLGELMGKNLAQPDVGKKFLRDDQKTSG